jgi:ribonuclease Y
MEVVIIILAGVVLIVGAFLFGQLYAVRINMAKRIREADNEARRIRDGAVVDADNLKKEKLIEVSDEWYRKRQEFDDQTESTRVRLRNQQDDLLRKERAIEQKGDLVTRKEKDLIQKEAAVQNQVSENARKSAELDSLIQSQNEKLIQIARMTAEEAKQVLMNNLLEQARAEASQHVRQVKEQAQQTAREEARRILLQAMNRSAIDHTIETTVTTVKLPNNEMKGRIIGREGRNIRAFETITGCEVMIDDTPQTVFISGFDPIRREVARLALESLVNDGRIHPGRIEDVVEKARRDLDETILLTGEEALFEASVHGTHVEIVKLLGKLKYRLHDGQNLLQHSVETAILAGNLAAELGFDVQLAKRAGILHDIGFAVERADQHHAVVGAEIVRKFGENQIVQQAILNHHETPLVAHPISVIVSVANMLSKQRPGAQRESLENYVKRLTRLEDLVTTFQGVSKAYAVQAGREVRILVDAQVVDDQRMTQLADEITHKVEKELEYIGQIKITLTREYRAIDFAK